MKLNDIIAFSTIVDNIDQLEERIRMDIVSVPFINENVVEDYNLSKVYNTQKEMNEKQMKLLESIKEKLKLIDIEDASSNFSLANEINILIEGINIERFNCDILLFLSTIDVLDNDLYLNIKDELINALNCNEIDATNKESLFTDLLVHSKKLTKNFDDNYKKLTKRKE